MRVPLFIFLLGGAVSHTAHAAITVSHGEKVNAPAATAAAVSRTLGKTEEKLLNLDRKLEPPKEILLEEEPLSPSDTVAPTRGGGLPIPEPGTLAIFGAGLLLLLRKRSF